MPVDKNEAPEGHEAVSFQSCSGCAFFTGPCSVVSCYAEEREDGNPVHFIKKEREKTMEDQWEILTANTLDNFLTISSWVFYGHHIELKATNYDDWSACSFPQHGSTYRRKKPAQDVLLTGMRWITCDEAPKDGKPRHTVGRFRLSSRYEWRYTDAIWEPEDGWHFFNSAPKQYEKQWLDQEMNND